MEKSILTTLNTEDFTKLIIKAVKQANSGNPDITIQNDSDEDYMNQREAAKFLRITFPTIIRWKKEKKIPYYQEGRKVLYKKSELLNALRKNESLSR